MDATEFDDLYARSFRPLVRQLYAVTGDAEEARDCVQEAFVRAWSRRHSIRVDEQPEAWVRTTAYRLAVSRWRRVLRGRRAPDRALSPAAVTAPVDETRVALVAALRQLPHAQREALVLHHLADLPVAAVATQTGVPEGTVKARLSRGRAALALLLSDTVVDGAHRA